MARALKSDLGCGSGSAACQLCDFCQVTLALPTTFPYLQNLDDKVNAI